MRNILIAICSFIFVVSCQNSETNKIDKLQYDLDNVNITNVKLYADFHSKYLLDQLGYVYSEHFPKASIQPVYTTDDKVMQALLEDSVRLIVLMRECNEYELDKLRQMHQAKPLQYTFAYDAITLVKNKGVEDSVIHQKDLDKMVNLESDKFVVLKEHLDIFQHLLSKGNNKLEKVSINVVNDVESMRVFLNAHSDYYGILPYSLVADRHSESAKNLIKKFKWIGIQNDSVVVHPSQSTIYTKEWPLILPYTILYCNLSTEDGVGFVKFVHNRQSAKLILKAGLVPFEMPERDILIEDQSFTL